MLTFYSSPFIYLFSNKIIIFRLNNHISVSESESNIHKTCTNIIGSATPVKELLKDSTNILDSRVKQVDLICTTGHTWIDEHNEIQRNMVPLFIPKIIEQR